LARGRSRHDRPHREHGKVAKTGDGRQTVLADRLQQTHHLNVSIVEASNFCKRRAQEGLRAEGAKGLNPGFNTCSAPSALTDTGFQPIGVNLRERASISPLKGDNISAQGHRLEAYPTLILVGLITR
jgi:uncharacterized UPF0146 family protein